VVDVGAMGEKHQHLGLLMIRIGPLQKKVMSVNYDRLNKKDEHLRTEFRLCPTPTQSRRERPTPQENTHGPGIIEYKQKSASDPVCAVCAAAKGAAGGGQGTGGGRGGRRPQRRVTLRDSTGWGTAGGPMGSLGGATKMVGQKNTRQKLS